MNILRVLSSSSSFSTIKGSIEAVGYDSRSVFNRSYPPCLDWVGLGSWWPSVESSVNDSRELFPYDFCVCRKFFLVSSFQPDSPLRWIRGIRV